MTAYKGIETAARIYLNVKREARLLREASDILEELHMIDHIYLQQLRVSKLFSQFLSGLYRQQSTWEASRQTKASLKSMQNTMTREPQTLISPSGNQRTISSTQNSENVEIGHLNQSVSKPTLFKAQKLTEEIESCRTELQDLERNTNEIIEHVRLADLYFTTSLANRIS